MSCPYCREFSLALARLFKNRSPLGQDSSLDPHGRVENGRVRASRGPGDTRNCRARGTSGPKKRRFSLNPSLRSARGTSASVHHGPVGAVPAGRTTVAVRVMTGSNGHKSHLFAK